MAFHHFFQVRIKTFRTVFHSSPLYAASPLDFPFFRKTFPESSSTEFSRFCFQRRRFSLILTPPLSSIVGWASELDPAFQGLTDSHSYCNLLFLFLPLISRSLFDLWRYNSFLYQPTISLISWGMTLTSD